jgi:CAAX prenyl protease-like protein
MMKSKAWLPYVVPMGIYMAFLLVQTNANLLWVYPAKVIAVMAALIYFRNTYEELRPGFSLLAVVVGLVAIAIWIGIDSLYPKFGSGAAFDPTTISPLAQRNVFLAFRVVGAVIVVPVMEELFWRAFLIRWLVKEDFKSVPVGTFTGLSFAVTVGMFGAEHTQWLAGLVCGALYNWVYYKRKDVFACVIAHAVSNAALAAWVLARGDWKFW